MSEKENKQRSSTMAALLKDKPKRGRPRRDVDRQNVYVALTKEQKLAMRRLADQLAPHIVRADIPDLAITVLTARMEALRRAVADRNREMPEGITDLESLYLLWDLPLPPQEQDAKWTSLRVSPQQAIELGRLQGTLNAIFGSNRSETFSLGLTLLAQVIEDYQLFKEGLGLEDMRAKLTDLFL